MKSSRKKEKPLESGTESKPKFECYVCEVPVWGFSTEFIARECKLCEKHQIDMDELVKEEKKMQTEFPKSESSFLKAGQFQDQEIPLTFRGWEKKGNEDREVKGVKQSWKQNLKYCLRYSYPEYAIDEAGEKMLGKDGQPFKNKNYDPNFPHGYTVVYHFEEGVFDSGSLPLWNAFCLVRPNPGDLLLIGKTGKDKETKWTVKKAHSSKATTMDEIPTIQLDEKEETPF